MSESTTLEKNIVKDDNFVYPKCCPVCNVATSYVYRIEESNVQKATWYRCQCGVIFQEECPKGDNYDSKYLETYSEMKEGKLRLIHAAHTYANVIEEVTFGRMMLDVGFCHLSNMRFWEERGWLTWGIDKNIGLNYGGNLYKGDFCSYDFSLDIKGTEIEKAIDSSKIDRKFDMIWMNHVLEHFDDPIAAISKAYSLLSETGLVFIATPDADFINKVGVAAYPHWKCKEHYTIWTERALRRELERQGFKIILMRRNFSSRYSSWYDIHCIAQKNYF